ncbi:unnamed protein product [Dicrocoelium dendriticum]|nr:unnamed protein product [Dicrocoelium dendriticum]
MQKHLLGFIYLLLNSMWFLSSASSISYPPQPMAIITTRNNPHPSGRLITTDADYSRKVNVRVSDILTRQRAAEEASNRFSPQTSLIRSYGRPVTAMGTVISNSVSPKANIVVQPQHTPPSTALVLPLANSHSVIKEDRSWPPEHSQEFARVDVRVMGEKIDSEALLHLKPNSNVEAVRKLRKILGAELQAEWMSIDPPPKDSWKSARSTVIMSMPKPDMRLLTAVENLNFTVLRQVKGTDVIPIKLTPEQIDLLKDWLIQRATCQMDYIWEDLGPLFWPRWIRRGVCVNTVACSWPPGMRCRQSSSRSLKLLRWVCANNSSQSKPLRKRWHRDFSSEPSQKLRRGGHALPGARRRIPREERRTRRVRRLIQKLSLSVNGFHCEWNQYEYMVSDQCTCGCE